MGSLVVLIMQNHQANQFARDTAMRHQVEGIQNISRVIFETPGMAGSCGVGYSCAYSSTISWRNATTPLPMENNPRNVFERLFGASDTTDAKARLDLIQRDRSILDGVNEKLNIVDEIPVEDVADQ